MGDHAFEKGTVGAAPALVDGGAVRASAPGPVEFKTLVDPSPELETVVLNFGPSDYATIGTFFVVNALGGWRFGGAIRGPTAGTTGMLGALAGFLWRKTPLMSSNFGHSNIVCIIVSEPWPQQGHVAWRVIDIRAA